MRIFEKLFRRQKKKGVEKRPEIEDIEIRARRFLEALEKYHRQLEKEKSNNINYNI